MVSGGAVVLEAVGCASSFGDLDARVGRKRGKGRKEGEREVPGMGNKRDGEQAIRRRVRSEY